MTLPNPKLKSTISSSDNRVWNPISLDTLLIEIDHISKAGILNDSLILYRGQTNYSWPLDSTFVRNCIPTLFGNIIDYTQLPSPIRHRSTFHRAVTALLLMKFDKIISPHPEVYDKEQSHDIDPFFELFKNVQQYPEKYDSSPFVKGTNFIDWTNKFEIALYFSAIEGKVKKRKVSRGDGVLWIYDASSTGSILQVNKMQDTLDKMTTYDFLNGENGLPLMFHPQKQTNQHRASNQKPIYVSQMNFSYSLSEVWEQYEKNHNRKVFLKFVITEKMKKELADYLEKIGFTEEHVYPD